MHEALRRAGAIGALTLPHRVVMGSMHLGLETLDDGGAALAAFYGERARGGAGLIVSGGWAVNEEASGGPSYGVIGDERSRRVLARTVAAVHAGGGRIALQLFHAGRYAVLGGGRAVAPSAVASRFSREPPEALSDADVRRTVEDFARAAVVARELGFDAVELMASEGYLINQFCSPLTNRRDDEWGGDAARRQRFVLAIVERVRALAGLPLIVRMSGADLMDGSSSDAEVLGLARALAAAGADALNVGIGWHESRVPTVQALVPHGAWIGVAAAIKAAVGPSLPVIAGNRVNRLAQADALLASGACDFVSMARPFLADPELLRRGRRGEPVNVCIGCNQACIDRSLVDERVSCMVNPRAGRELEDVAPMSGDAARRRDQAGVATRPHDEAIGAARRPRAAARRRFAVVGGGPAGLEAARELAALGHTVTLFEAADELGGQFRLAREIPGKRDYGATIVALRARLRELGAELRCGARLGADDAERLHDYDGGVIVATGVLPRRLDLPGADAPHVVAYPDAIAAPQRLGARVAIVGAGGIGVDTAHLLSAPAAGDDEIARFLAEHGLTTTLAGTPLAAGIGSAATAGPIDAGGGRDAALGDQTLERRGDVPQAAATVHAEAAEAGRRHVTLLCRSRRIGRGMGRTTRWTVADALRRAGVVVRTEVEYRAITSEGVEIVGADGAPALIEADSIVVAAGQEPNDPLGATLARRGIPHRVIGGARAGAADAVQAFAEGRDAARELAATTLAADHR